MTPAPEETLPNERQHMVDALRGFALLGILVVNIASFASTYYGLGIPDPLAVSLADRSASFVRAFVFETKFYLLFSFLFGYSFTLQMRAAERDGKRFVPRMVRRLVGLWVIGVLHAVVLYYGDILTTYAVLGGVLLLLRRRGDVFMACAAMALVLVVSLAWAGVGHMYSQMDMQMAARAAYAEAEAALVAYRATPALVVVQHLRDLSQVWWVTGLVQAPEALAMFFAGFVAGRRGLLAHVEAHGKLLRQVVMWGLAIGLPGALAYGLPALRLNDAVRELMGLAVTLLTAPFLTAAYAAGMLLVFQAGPGRVLAQWLAPAGRMALSNYLLQSLVCAWIFLAYGLRWIGTVGPLASFAIALAIFAGNLLLSRWWMHHFTYGPAEWLLRAFTNLQLPPLLRRRARAVPAP
ncbi:DUF418 domain-containing protein [Variovorax paradoxus]|uniref:DUF418 domain-containing protein n=1 Tax=Variovorax paradoxus TaxID=34073 RepID=A0A6I6HKJ4_VARPD|nr:DUF418 domain-containing protein [Variovorax paradoxus]QGW83399.1 DUF418 domain-containing protein [Variovorax paradoxus]